MIHYKWVNIYILLLIIISKNNNNNEIKKIVNKLNTRFKKKIITKSTKLKYLKINKKIKNTACFIILNLKLNDLKFKINKLKEEKIKNFRTQRQYESFISLLKLDLYKFCSKLVLKIKNKILINILMITHNKELIDKIINFNNFSFEKYYTLKNYLILDKDKEIEKEMLDVEKILNKDYNRNSKTNINDNDIKNNNINSNTTKQTIPNNLGKNIYLLIIILCFIITIIKCKHKIKIKNK